MNVGEWQKFTALNHFYLVLFFPIKKIHATNPCVFHLYENCCAFMMYSLKTS